jgi:hypothetical protein
MRNHNNTGAFSVKIYIHKTWDGIFDFFISVEETKL